METIKKMRFLFFSSIFWLSTLAIAAADNTFYKVCKIPRPYTARTIKSGKKKYVKYEDFQKYARCKQKKHVLEVNQLTQQLLNGHNCPDTPDPKTTICDGTEIFKDPKTLSEHIKCDHKNNETKQECIRRLQNLLQGYIDVHQELPLGDDESPKEQNTGGLG